jgi:putative membrane protein
MHPLPYPLLVLASNWGWSPRAGGGLWLIIPLLWITVIGLLVWLVARRRSPAADPTDRAREVLAERYAQGELSTDEYRERLDNLRARR